MSRAVFWGVAGFTLGWVLFGPWPLVAAVVFAAAAVVRGASDTNDR